MSKVVSKCDGCGTSATFESVFADDVMEADSGFRATHKACTSSKIQTPKFVPKDCTREQPHAGPCNGWPCVSVLEKMARNLMEQYVLETIKSESTPRGFLDRLFDLFRPRPMLVKRSKDYQTGQWQ